MSVKCTVFVDFFVQPDMIDQWKDAHRPVWHSCANEPECLLFDVFHDPFDSDMTRKLGGHFRLVEVWNGSRSWFDTVQLSKPYYKTLWPKSEPTWRKPMFIEYMEREGEGFCLSAGLFVGLKTYEDVS
ncbi:hypothetical protein K431DRAFT_276250 [Polychaeton citri CBS 116435]|uniref:Uncharacterized protein n=1 Tax=Polychaeton citri CBS 116435 TaxID=1314669 RepID=A0A9P4UJA4_9PEZI|nr:hypothetical protein K431DRAFT_276250 [Polychaeton citri CBS 116435]